MFADVGVTGAIVGKIQNSHEFIITSGKHEAVLFDFEKDIISGCRPTCSDLTDPQE
jgi:selenophosphate synthetase-related protein